MLPVYQASVCSLYLWASPFRIVRVGLALSALDIGKRPVIHLSHSTVPGEINNGSNKSTEGSWDNTNSTPSQGVKKTTEIVLERH